MTSFIIMITGGITLFLFGLNTLKSLLFTITNTRFKNILTSFVNSNFKAFLFGIVATAIMQSSSGLTAIAIVLLSSDLLNLKSTVLIILGSNVGTCITPFIFTFNIGDYSLVFIIIGYLLTALKKNILKTLGNIIISLGLIFLGLNFLESGLNGISEASLLNSIFSLNKSPIFSLTISTLLATILQSSSATIAITQSLYESNIITLTNSIFFMLGANIGTTISSYSYASNLKKEAKVAIKINIFLNILGSLVFIIFIKHFEILILKVGTLLKASKELTVAYSHLLFNIISSLTIFIFFDFLFNLATKKIFRVDTDLKIC